MALHNSKNDMEEFNRTNVKELSAKIRSTLKGLEEELGISFSFDGGSFTADKLALRVEVTLADADGKRVVSDSTNHIADEAAKMAGIEFKSPHFIGSIWQASGKIGLCKMVDYQRKNRAYPFIVESVADGKRYKLGMYSFNSGGMSEVLKPKAEDFHVWFTIPEEEATTKQLNTIVKVGYYVTASFSEDFYNACCDVFEAGMAERLWGYIYNMAFEKNTTEDDTIAYMRASISTKRRKK